MSTLERLQYHNICNIDSIEHISSYSNDPENNINISLKRPGLLPRNGRAGLIGRVRTLIVQGVHHLIAFAMMALKFPTRIQTIARNSPKADIS